MALPSLGGMSRVGVAVVSLVLGPWCCSSRPVMLGIGGTNPGGGGAPAASQPAGS